MVKSTVMVWLLVGMAQQLAKPAIERLDPPRRAAVIMALLALVLTGILLVTCVMVGAHWVRRMARHKPGAGGATVGAARLRASLQSVLPDIETSDTIHLETSSKETKAES